MNVLISIIESDKFIPYQWALLKTYADEDANLSENVVWLDPLHETVSEAAENLKKTATFSKRYDFKNVDVLGLSCYVWNQQEQFRIAELAKKENPNCLVVAGGPETDYQDREFFKKNPQIDIVVKKDGEIAFRRILSAVFSGHRDFSSIPGLVLKGPNYTSLDTGSAEVLREFKRSPWLHNKKYFETWIRKNRSPLRVTYETNRGCPYSCTYCNWGSNTMSKLRQFDQDNIRNEIKWFSQFKINTLWIADANFGILPRDTSIGGDLLQLGDNSQKPEVHIFAAKNHPERFSQIAIDLYKAGLSTGFKLGIQSTSPATLSAIGRTNMGIEKHRALAAKLSAHDVPIGVQLIVGCPGETLDSWKQALADVFDIGAQGVQVFPFQVLHNTPANDPLYRKKWEIKTVKFGKGEFITSTVSFTSDDYVEMNLFVFILLRMRRLGIFRSVVNMIRTDRGSLKDFFDGVYDRFFSDPNFDVAHAELSRLRTELQHYVQNEDSEEQFDPQHFLSRISIVPNIYADDFRRYLKISAPLSTGERISLSP